MPGNALGGGTRVRLRIHLAPIGFDVARLVAPALRLRADVVILLTERRDDRTGSPLGRVLRQLKSGGVRTDVVECDIWDPASVVDVAGGVVTAAPSHDYLFNVSTGARTAGIGGTIASMFWRIQPYYQPVAYVDSSVVSEVDAPVTGPPFFLPTLRVPTLDAAAAETLRYLAAEPGPVSKRQLMIHMRTAATIFPRTKPQVSPQAFHAQANVILHRLESWGFIETDGRGKRLRIQVTETGQAGSRMFRHVVEPRAVRPSLRVN